MADRTGAKRKIAMANSPKLATAADRTILAPNLAVCKQVMHNLQLLDYTDNLFDYTDKPIENMRFCAR